MSDIDSRSNEQSLGEGEYVKDGIVREGCPNNNKYTVYIMLFAISEVGHCPKFLPTTRCEHENIPIKRFLSVLAVLERHSWSKT